MRPIEYSPICFFSDVFFMPYCGDGLSGKNNTEVKSFFLHITLGVHAIHIISQMTLNFITCLRQCQLGFSTLMLLFFFFPTQFFESESLSPTQPSGWSVFTNTIQNSVRKFCFFLPHLFIYYKDFLDGKIFSLFYVLGNMITLEYHMILSVSSPEKQNQQDTHLYTYTYICIHVHILIHVHTRSCIYICI